VGIKKSQKTIANTQNLRGNPKEEKITERKRWEFHYNNGDYKGFSGILRFLDSIDHDPSSRWEGSLIYTNHIK